MLPVTKPTGVSSGTTTTAPKPTSTSTLSAYATNPYGTVSTAPTTAQQSPTQTLAAIATAHLSNAATVLPATPTTATQSPPKSIVPYSPMTSGLSTGPAKPSSSLPFTPPMTAPSNGPAASTDQPYTSDASQALYNDPNLPPQYAIPDDSHKWNDPAPTALVNSVVQSASVSNPGIPPVLAKPSLWTRILTFLGFIKPAVNAATVHGEMTVEQAAKSIVHRVENGDQNAMSLMIMIRENALKGDPTAQKTYNLMRAHAEKTAPAGDRPTGRDDVNSGWARAVYLANGPLLRDVTVSQVASRFGAEDEHAFIQGVIRPTHPAVNAAHHHGKVIGMARKIQAVRMPGSRISDYSATVGWELGE